MSKTILTGLRANGDLHIGNYFGGIEPMVRLQQSLEEGDRLFMFIPDLHSLTTPVEHGELYDNVITNLRAFMAAGLDVNHPQTTVYRQSRITHHSELAWILNCFAYFGEVSRMTEFKDKSDKLGHKSVSVGLFDYPVLMAADILLYGANYVPLGDDQKQHMELTRTLAERMNNKFGDLFVVPESWEEQLKFARQDVSLRIKSLAHPESKMSKSVSDPRGTITLFDSPEEAAKKVMSAETDSVGVINFSEDQPGISNLITLAAKFSEKHIDEVAGEWAGKSSYGDLKKYVAEQAEQFLRDFQVRFDSIQEADALAALEKGETVASGIAKKTVEKVFKAVGLSK